MKDRSFDEIKGGDSAASSALGIRPGVPQFDAEEFREFIDKIDATEEEKIEYLHLLWKIAVTFVDISFGVDSTQQIVSYKAEIDSPQESRLLQINDYPHQFKRAAVDAARKGES